MLVMSARQILAFERRSRAKFIQRLMASLRATHPVQALFLSDDQLRPRLESLVDAAVDAGFENENMCVHFVELLLELNVDPRSARESYPDLFDASVDAKIRLVKFSPGCRSDIFE